MAHADGDGGADGCGYSGLMHMQVSTRGGEMEEQVLPTQCADLELERTSR